MRVAGAVLLVLGLLMWVLPGPGLPLVLLGGLLLSVSFLVPVTALIGVRALRGSRHGRTRPSRGAYGSCMSQDRAVDAVEQLLGASRRRETTDDRVEANVALWLCGCYSDHDEVPIWLVYERAADGLIEWRRVPSRTHESDLVNAKDLTGDHTFPASVLAWLQRREADPYGGSGDSGDAVMLEALRAEILAD